MRWHRNSGDGGIGQLFRSLARTERDACCGLHGLLLVLIAAAPAGAQDRLADQEKDPRWQEVYQSEADGYRFRTAGPQPETLERQPQPVMKWVSLNDFNGAVFVWTLDGRPEVVGTIFSFPTAVAGRRNVMHEFHSLSEQRVEATGPRENAFSFDQRAESKPIPGAPVPADSPARRQLQARALAREFSGHMKRQGERWELRLLNQPLYRYEKASGGVLGGALYALVGYVTDPEILLLIEARETEAGSAWYYAAARFSDKSLWLSHKGTEVWEFLDDIPATDAPYYLSPARIVEADSAGK